MIVKNELKTIYKTLASTLPHVNRFTILDSGSTDGTQQAVSKAADEFDTPGRVFEEDFEDFATSRNRCIELAEREAIFFLTMDANDELRRGDRLVDWCQQYRNKPEPACHSFLMRVHWNHEVFSMQRVFRSDANCRYVGAVHEYLKTEEPPGLTIDDANVFHDRGNDEATSHERWLRDCTILERALRRDPSDSRSQFYLAQSYVSIGRYAEGFEYYTKRIEAAGADEETYEALYRRAELADRFLDFPWRQVEQMYLQAHRHSPGRAEPLVRIGQHYAERQDFAAAYRCLRHACDMPEPSGLNMNVDLELYRYGRWDLLGSVAYYVERYDEGAIAIRTALKFAGLSPESRWQLEQNLKVYEMRRSG